MEGNSKVCKSITLGLIFIGGFGLLSGRTARAQSHFSPDFGAHTSEAHKGCSNRTLQGDYGFQIEGTLFGPNFSLRTLTMTHFSGNGKLSGVDYVVVNGMPPLEEWRPSSGTYKINPDCTGSASIEVAPDAPPLSYHFVVVSNGRKILLVVDGDAINGVAYKVD